MDEESLGTNTIENRDGRDILGELQKELFIVNHSNISYRESQAAEDDVEVAYINEN